MKLPRRPIATERLRLEPLTTADAPALSLQIDASRAHLATFMEWAADNRFEHTLAFTSRAEAAWELGTSFHFVIREGGEVVGVVSLRLNPDQVAEGTLGYWVSATGAGRGLMSEAAQAVRAFAFHQLALQRVELRAHVDNRASQRVAEKLGMRREGRLRGALRRRGDGPQDAYIYGMVAADAGIPGGVDASSSEAPAKDDPAADFSRGLLTAVVQDEADGAVLMVAHMDQQAFELTRSTGHAWFWSRSRERLWEKGETSGNHLVVVAMSLDCDGDAVLVTARPAGPSCHTGQRSCFHNPL